MGRFLALKDIDPPSHPWKDANRVASPIEAPRSYIGIEADRVALTKRGPSEGVYFFNAESGELSQWVNDHWEFIGQSFLGDLALSDPGLAPKPTPRPFSYGAGGSQVQIGGPLGSGNPINRPITPPAPSTPDITDLGGGGQAQSNVATIVDNDPAVTVLTFPALVVPAGGNANNLADTLFLLMNAAVPAGTTLFLSVLVNGTPDIVDVAFVGPTTAVSYSADSLDASLLTVGNNVVTVTLRAAGGGGDVTLTTIVPGARVRGYTQGFIATVV